MADIRRRVNVWDLEDDWAGPVLWYARAVKDMKERPLAHPLSWRFYGAIHGVDAALWQSLGHLDPSEPRPSGQDRDLYWSQCQHGTWFFLPWHRGYLLAFEATVRAAIVSLGGPTDWTLPYWNYFEEGQNRLPRAFATEKWPDGARDNPLFVPQRYGPTNDGDVYVDVNRVNLAALNEPAFTGVASGGSPGFGGVDTGFAHGGTVHGRLERQPHDVVHGLVGGADPSGGGDPSTWPPGLMSDPDTAGLDPIFWLHHANIDRLWEVWRQNPPSAHADPTESGWLDELFERTFILPVPSNQTPGYTAWTYTASEMSDLDALGYTYDDLGPAAQAPQPLAQRRQRLAGAAVAAHEDEGAPTPREENVELLGANRDRVSVRTEGVTADVQLDPGARRTVTASLDAAGEAPPDRVFLNLEHVRANLDSIVLQLYVEAPGDRPGRSAGTVSLFGARKASVIDGTHAGSGITLVVEITDVIDEMHLAAGFDVDALQVRVVPTTTIPDRVWVIIGRISIYRQGR